MARLRGPPGHPPLLDQQDANGWTALMWCAHWGEDEHVAALLDAGADDSLRTTQPWFNMALEYPAGIRLLMWDQLANVKAARPGLGSADAIQCSTCRLIIVAHDRGHGIVCLRFPTS
jgi:hypothetical protein